MIVKALRALSILLCLVVVGFALMVDAGCTTGAKEKISEQVSTATTTSSISEASSATQISSEPTPSPSPTSTPMPSASATPSPTDEKQVAASGSDAVDASKASEQQARTIALDPGHGGPESGASAYGLVEKDVNLEIALKLADLLRENGYRAVLTREKDESVSADYKGGSYAGGLGRDLQARVDIANAAQADLFISIHDNGSSDPDESGTEVWYDPQRDFGDKNLEFAKMVEQSLVDHIRALGYAVVKRGIKDDTSFRIFQGRPYNIYVLGAGNGGRPHVPTKMPGVLGESLFISNAGDAAMLRQERTLDAIAAGYLEAIESYFEQYF